MSIDIDKKSGMIRNQIDLITVAVYEYANSTSAHDTVLEHRFSPMHTSFSS